MHGQKSRERYNSHSGNVSDANSLTNTRKKRIDSSKPNNKIAKAGKENGPLL